MAIIAGAIENRSYFGRHVRVRLDRLRLIDRRVGLRRPDELETDKGDHNSNPEPLEYFSHFVRLPDRETGSHQASGIFSGFAAAQCGKGYALPISTNDFRGYAA
jgi:hypothetical protein